MTSAPCPTCEGTGQEIPDKCVTCGGAGRVRETSTVTLEIPAGVSDGMELRVGGSGHAGIAGAGAWDASSGIRPIRALVAEKRRCRSAQAGQAARWLRSRASS